MCVLVLAAADDVFVLHSAPTTFIEVISGVIGMFMLIYKM